MDIASIISSSSSALSIYKTLTNRPALLIDSKVNLASYESFWDHDTSDFKKVTLAQITFGNTGKAPLKNCSVKLEEISHSRYPINLYFDSFKFLWADDKYETHLRQGETEILTLGQFVESSKNLEFITSDEKHRFKLPNIRDCEYYLFIFSLFKYYEKAKIFS